MKALSKFTKVKFGKNLVRIWVNFDRNLVYGNQGVMIWQKLGCF